MTLRAAVYPVLYHCPEMLLPVSSRPEYEDELIPWYPLMYSCPPLIPSVLLYSFQEDGMIDYRGYILSKCAADSSSPVMIVGSIISASNPAIDITDDNKFGIGLTNTSD